MPAGSVPYISSYCTSMEIFQDHLVGKKTTSIVIGAGSTYYSCTNATVAKQITQLFSACKSTCTTQSFSCNGETWHVGRCKKGGEIVVGGEICTCNGSLSIRPCTDNDNWGGAGPNTCGQSSQTLSITVNYSAT